MLGKPTGWLIYNLTLLGIENHLYFLRVNSYSSYLRQFQKKQSSVGTRPASQRKPRYDEPAVALSFGWTRLIGITDLLEGSPLFSMEMELLQWWVRRARGVF